ncbi:hypothetical protein P9578_11485 [Brevibacillus choshinensis]|nr:hypothetical protein [Brevibacillus choshinensis]MED4782711.1 hypothetical protein [Brevibacillus choshinensis]
MAVLEDDEDRQLHLIATLSDKSSQDVTEPVSWTSMLFMKECMTNASTR